MKPSVIDLPFKKDALDPHISSRTLEFHYEKHHKGYLTKLEGAIQNTENEGKSLEDLVKTTQGGIFNNAAQVWNHNFYWQSLSPEKPKPEGEFLSAIEKAFGSFDDFKEKFSTAAATNFGSGWTWLVKDGGGNLQISNTSNAGCPLTDGHKPLLVCDVWEHAYYLDYQNARPKYISSFLEIANWKFAAENFA